MSAVIETTGLQKVYRGAERPAVDSLDLRVEPGQVFGFLGPNAAGKTTTIGMLLGNVFPTAGRGFVLGKPLGDRAVRRKIGYLPEKFQFHEFLTATEFLDLHGRLYGLSRTERLRRIPRVLEQVGLAERANSELRTFSKGMQQRAGLAQAILHEPELVILDEPTSALDPLGRRAVRDLILTLRAQGTTVVLNSHLLSEVERTCDQLAIVRQGRIVRQGSVAEITAPTGSVVVVLETLTQTLTPVAARFGATDVTTNPPTLTVRLPDLTLTPDLIAALVQAGARIHAVTPTRETLEDAFLRIFEAGTGETSAT